MIPTKLKIILENIIQLGVVLLICCTLGLMFYYNVTMYDSLTDGIEIDFKDYSNKYDFGEMTQFMVISERFAKSHIYSDKYNCVNYTTDLYNIVSELGFEVKKIKGCPDDNNTCHQFLKVMVDFEPQSAEFIDYSLKYPKQEILK